MADKLRVCFVSLDNFAALVDNSKFGRIGGAEIQQTIIGKEIAKRGYKVSFITRDHGQDDKLEIDDMRIIKAYAENVGIPVLRFLHPRLTSLWRAMRKADADIYYQRTSDSITGIVAAFCRRHRRKFVFAVASNCDCMTDLPLCPARHAQILYLYGLRRANLVIAQTETQQKLLRENFSIDSTLISNCTPDYGASRHDAGHNRTSQGSHLLWVGAFSPVKRLELLLDLAEQLSGLQFDVVGDGNRESAYVQSLRLRAKSMPNVHLHGTVSHECVHLFYQRAAALMCTSHAEGFPNVFLEAWSHGLPIVTTFDPDGVISAHGLGKVGKDVSELALVVRELLVSPDQCRNASQAAREYYKENHAVDKVMERYERAFYDIGNSAGDTHDGDGA